MARRGDAHYPRYSLVASARHPLELDPGIHAVPLPLGRASASVDEVVDDVEFSGQPHVVDLVILHDALDVTSCFRKRNPLDPVDDRIDALAARVTVFLDPV